MKNKQKNCSLIVVSFTIVLSVFGNAYRLNENIERMNQLTFLANMRKIVLLQEQDPENTIQKNTPKPFVPPTVEPVENQEQENSLEISVASYEEVNDDFIDGVVVAKPSNPIAPKRLYSELKSDSKGHKYRDYFDTTSQTTAIMMGGEELSGQATYLPRSLVDRGNDCFYIEGIDRKEFNIYLGEHAYYLYYVTFDVATILDDVYNNQGQNAITIYK